VRKAEPQGHVVRGHPVGQPLQCVLGRGSRDTDLLTAAANRRGQASRLLRHQDDQRGARRLLQGLEQGIGGGGIEMIGGVDKCHLPLRAAGRQRAALDERADRRHRDLIRLRFRIGSDAQKVRMASGSNQVAIRAAPAGVSACRGRTTQQRAGKQLDQMSLTDPACTTDHKAMRKPPVPTRAVQAHPILDHPRQRGIRVERAADVRGRIAHCERRHAPTAIPSLRIAAGSVICCGATTPTPRRRASGLGAGAGRPPRPVRFIRRVPERIVTDRSR
jgi:hypothetical protein